jgi:hypothetical protein
VWPCTEDLSRQAEQRRSDLRDQQPGLLVRLRRAGAEHGLPLLVEELDAQPLWRDVHSDLPSERGERGIFRHGLPDLLSGALEPALLGSLLSGARGGGPRGGRR